MGKRPALVLSPTPFNKKIKLALVAPITSRVREHGFEVTLHHTKIQGVVLCHQVKVIDFIERGVQFAEKAHGAVIKETLARVRVLVAD